MRYPLPRAKTSSTGLSIAEIAREVGYEDVKFFVQIFKKTLSITPRDFRALRKS